MQAVFPGKPQAKLQALSTGLWEGKRIITYISGNALVILGGPVEVLQTIYHDAEDELEAVAIDEHCGKIATCSASRIYIYEPSKQADGSSNWSHQTSFTLQNSTEPLTTLSWGISDELLVGSSSLTLFSTIHSSDPPSQTWNRSLSSPVKLAQFSPGASLIACTARYDRLVKIWRRLIFSTYEGAPGDFDCSYLSHPRTVTGLHWRKASEKVQQDDNVLYTICVDNKVRVWTTPGNSHGLHILQLWTEIDLLESIKPRSLAAGTSEKRRYVFVVDGRDTAAATERAVQEANTSGGKDSHALAHLVEVANRNPELVVVLDGRGGMSAWGLESVGCKVRKKGDVFNVAHVDSLPWKFAVDEDQNEDEENVQFVNFCGGEEGDGLTILVHQFGGVVKWWEGRIDEIFDLETRRKRVKLKATWTGHKKPVTKIAQDVNGRAVMTLAANNEGIVWKQEYPMSGMSMLKKSQVSVSHDVKDMCVMQDGNFVLVLCQNRISLWDARPPNAVELASVQHQLQGQPLRLFLISESTSPRKCNHVAAVSSELKGAVWKVHLPLENGMTNGHTEHPDSAVAKVGSFDIGVEDIALFVPVEPVRCQTVAPGSSNTAAKAVALSGTESGKIISWSAKVHSEKKTIQWIQLDSVETGIVNQSISSAASGHKIALVDMERTTLSIWDMKNAHLDYDERFHDKNIVQKLRWTSTPDGYYVLAVSFAHHVRIYSQMRYDYLTHIPSWGAIRNISVLGYTPHPIGDVAWINKGQVVVGKGNQVYVCTDKVELDESLAPSLPSRIPALGPETPKSRSLFEVVGHLNRELPLYHPHFWLGCILAGKLRISNRMLISLHKAMKFYSEGDEVDPLLGIAPEEVYGDYEPTVSVANGTPYDSSTYFTNPADDEPERLTEDMAASLNSTITKIQLPHLYTKEQSLLANIVEGAGKLDKQSSSIDDNASRFLLLFELQAVRTGWYGVDHPLANGIISKSGTRQGATEKSLVGWREICLAWSSGSQDILLDLVSRHFGGKMTWERARTAGIGCWLGDVDALRAQFEIVARNEYMRTEERNPVDCALYYLALRKKNVLLGLWRMATWNREQAATQRLLSNNFQDPRWKTAALKNAYALMGKRRFEYAASFFLLAGNLKDAVGVLANQLNDMQLAIAVARVYEGDGGPVLRAFLEEKVIPKAVSEGDRWCVAWAWGLVGRNDLAMRALVAPLHTFLPDPPSPQSPIPAPHFRTEDPSLVVFYQQLRDRSFHTLSGVPKDQSNAEHRVQPEEEWEFVMKHVRIYLRMGCTLLALGLARNFKFSTPITTARPSSPTAATNEPINQRDKPRRRSSLVSTTPMPSQLHNNKPGAIERKQPPKEAFQEPSASSLLDGFGF